MSLIRELAGHASLLLGFLFLALAAVGVLKLPDAYCRAHALAKAMTLGIAFLLLALGLLVEGISWFKLAAAMAFQFITIPVSSHLLCLAAYRQGAKRWTKEGWATGPAPSRQP